MFKLSSQTKLIRPLHRRGTITTKLSFLFSLISVTLKPPSASPYAAENHKTTNKLVVGATNNHLSASSRTRRLLFVSSHPSVSPKHRTLHDIRLSSIQSNSHPTRRYHHFRNTPKPQLHFNNNFRPHLRLLRPFARPTLGFNIVFNSTFHFVFDIVWLLLCLLQVQENNFVDEDSCRNGASTTKVGIFEKFT